MKTKKQVVLIVLDGWGYREEKEHNAMAQAKTPVFDKIWKEYPHTLLEASGLHVGLPEGQMGNSEVGHMTIGAGKVIDTDLVRIAKAIKNDEFIKNPAFVKLFKHVQKNNSTLHVKGLLGNGGVHAHSDHLTAFLQAAKRAGIKKLALHLYTDGRDTAPQSAGGFLVELEKVLQKIGIGNIATVSGRFYAMDRDNNWDRVKRAEEAMFEGKGNLQLSQNKPSVVLKELYKTGIMDEHLEPIVFLGEKDKAYKIEKNDGVFFFNFRADRARQISQKILERAKKDNLCFVTMTEYDPSTKLGASSPFIAVAFPPVPIETTLAKEISAAGLRQAHIAETEKFPHATYFLNGGIEKPYKGEKHILLDSRKDVKTHDLAPEMRAEAIADKAIEEIKKGTNFIFINFANADMVGHTANVPAIVKALETTDRELGRVLEVLHKNGGHAFVTADHGNAEINFDKKAKVKHTSHTTSPVPAILISQTNPSTPHKKTQGKKLWAGKLRKGGTLADITPTILEILNIKKPKSMTGESLI
jgi:2,3-bisphosphoglycerate-independent phosphoglycerate mutase